MSTDTRRRILDATLDLLRDDPRGATVENVAARARLTRQGLYRHFPDRGQLLVAAARHADERNGRSEGIRPIAEAPDAGAMLDRFAEFLGAFIPGVYEVAEAMSAMRHEDQSARAALQDRRRLRWASSLAMARRIARDGRLRPGLTVDGAAGLLMAIGSIAFWAELVKESGWSRRRFVERTRALLRSALLDERKVEIAAGRRERRPRGRSRGRRRVG
jgi:AcrR family transcriptional regulator